MAPITNERVLFAKIPTGEPVPGVRPPSFISSLATPRSLPVADPSLPSSRPSGAPRRRQV